MMVIALQVDHLTKEFGKKLALDDISFTVEKGEIFGIIGMSGSGKTTLLNHLIGFLEPDEGEIRYHSSLPLKGSKEELQGLRKHMADVKRMFGFSPQTPSFYPKLTIQENLLHFGALHKLEKKQMVENMEHLLKLTKLDQHRHKLSENLSGGMQRRLSIMCGLIHKPEVLILDEPTADLDPVLRDETWKLITEINKLGTTVIVASHFLEDLETYCSRVAIINSGKLLGYGSINQIKEKFSKKSIEIEIETTADHMKTIESQLSRNVIERIYKDGGIMTIYTNSPRETLFELAKIFKNGKAHAYALRLHRPTLKEVFEDIAIIQKDNE